MQLKVKKWTWISWIWHASSRSILTMKLYLRGLHLWIVWKWGCFMFPFNNLFQCQMLILFGFICLFKPRVLLAQYSAGCLRKTQEPLKWIAVCSALQPIGFWSFFPRWKKRTVFRLSCFCSGFFYGRRRRAKVREMQLKTCFQIILILSFQQALQGE